MAVTDSVTSLADEFLPAVSQGEILPLSERDAIGRLTELSEKDFDLMVDTLRRAASGPDGLGRLTAFLEILDEGTVGNDSRHLLNLKAAVMQTLVSLHIESSDLMSAAVAAAGALGVLSREPRRKDYPFLVILGMLLYDITSLHASKGEFRQAERSIDKALKVLERLARINPERYGTSHMMALDKATAIYHDRDAQAELLTRYHTDATLYMQQMVEQGTTDVALRLTRSLAGEGVTLARMGRHREAMQYFTRSLKYLTKIEPEFSLEQLRISIALGESMLHVNSMRDKGVHLLNTMLHKATRLGAEAEHRHIVDVLFHAKSRTFDILSIWHKIFPNS